MRSFYAAPRLKGVGTLYFLAFEAYLKDNAGRIKAIFSKHLAGGYLSARCSSLNRPYVIFWLHVNSHSLRLLLGPFRSGLVVPVRDSSMSQIDLFENYSYSDRPCAHSEDLLRNNYINKCKYERTLTITP